MGFVSHYEENSFVHSESQDARSCPCLHGQALFQGTKVKTAVLHNGITKPRPPKVRKGKFSEINMKAYRLNLLRDVQGPRGVNPPAPRVLRPALRRALPQSWEQISSSKGSDLRKNPRATQQKPKPTPKPKQKEPRFFGKAVRRILLLPTLVAVQPTVSEQNQEKPPCNPPAIP